MKSIEELSAAEKVTHRIVAEHNRGKPERALASIAEGSHFGMLPFVFWAELLVRLQKSESTAYIVYDETEIELEELDKNLYTLAYLTHTSKEKNAEHTYLATVPDWQEVLEQSICMYLQSAEQHITHVLKVYAQYLFNITHDTDPLSQLRLYSELDEVIESALELTWIFAVKPSFFTERTPHSKILMLLAIADAYTQLKQSHAEDKLPREKEREHLRRIFDSLRTLLYNRGGTESGVVAKRLQKRGAAKIADKEAPFVGRSEQNVSEQKIEAMVEQLRDISRSELTPTEEQILAEVRTYLETEFSSESVATATSASLHMVDLPVTEFQKRYGFNGLNSTGQMYIPATFLPAQLRNVITHETLHNLLELSLEPLMHAVNEAVIEQTTEHPLAYTHERVLLRLLLHMLQLDFNALAGNTLPGEYNTTESVAELLCTAGKMESHGFIHSEARIIFETLCLHSFGLEGLYKLQFTASEGLLYAPELIQRLHHPLLAADTLLHSWRQFESRGYGEIDLVWQPHRLQQVESSFRREQGGYTQQQIAQMEIKDAITQVPSSDIDLIIQQFIQYLSHTKLLAQQSVRAAVQFQGDFALEKSQLHGFMLLRLLQATRMHFPHTAVSLYASDFEETYFNWAAAVSAKKDAAYISWVGGGIEVTTESEVQQIIDTVITQDIPKKFDKSLLQISNFHLRVCAYENADTVYRSWLAMLVQVAQGTATAASDTVDTHELFTRMALRKIAPSAVQQETARYLLERHLVLSRFADTIEVHSIIQSRVIPNLLKDFFSEPSDRAAA